jgi:hypothetical protein
MCNRVRWNDVLSNPLFVGTMVMFGTNQVSGKIAEKVFRLSKDHEVSGEVRRLIRERGVVAARRICRKSLRRRLLID